MISVSVFCFLSNVHLRLWLISIFLERSEMSTGEAGVSRTSAMVLFDCIPLFFWCRGH